MSRKIDKWGDIPRPRKRERWHETRADWKRSKFRDRSLSLPGGRPPSEAAIILLGLQEGESLQVPGRESVIRAMCRNGCVAKAHPGARYRVRQRTETHVFVTRLRDPDPSAFPDILSEATDEARFFPLSRRKVVAYVTILKSDPFGRYCIDQSMARESKNLAVIEIANGLRAARAFADILEEHEVPCRVTNRAPSWAPEICDTGFTPSPSARP